MRIPVLPTFAACLRNDVGSALIIFAFAFVALGGMGALALDAGVGYVRGGQVQNAADAAVAMATQFAALNALALDPAEITISSTWSTNDTIRVAPTETVDFFFAPIIVVDSADGGASAAAVVGSLVGTDGLVPFGLVIPAGGFQFGHTYDIKLGDGEGGNYNALALGGNGANAYRGNIINGTTESFSVGKTIDMEPGNMVGPTVTGLTGCIGADPNYNWTDLVNPDGTLKGIDDDNPRIITIPIVTAPLPGRSDVTITAFAMFYVEGPPSSWSGGELTGAFINTVIEGQLGPLSANPLSPRVTRLVE